MPNNELLHCICYTLHSLVMTRTSRFFVRPPPLIGPPVEPPSSHPHTLTPSQEDSHWVSFHFQQSHDELVWVTKSTIMSEVEIVYVLQECMRDIEKCMYVFQGGIKAAIFLAPCLHSSVDELLWQHSKSENQVKM